MVDLQAHEGALWSLAVRPDGKGFVTASADKEVKFWDFTVSPVYVCVTVRQDAVNAFMLPSSLTLLSIASILLIALSRYLTSL